MTVGYLLSNPSLQNYAVCKLCVFDRLCIVFQRFIGESRPNCVGPRQVSRVRSEDMANQRQQRVETVNIRIDEAPYITNGVCEVHPAHHPVAS